MGGFRLPPTIRFRCRMFWCRYCTGSRTMVRTSPPPSSCLWAFTFPSSCWCYRSTVALRAVLCLYGRCSSCVLLDGESTLLPRWSVVPMDWTMETRKECMRMRSLSRDGGPCHKDMLTGWPSLAHVLRVDGFVGSEASLVELVVTRIS